MPGDVIQIGPFVGGLNADSDPTSVADNELVECENFELDLDGSLVSRPPFQDSSILFPLGLTGNVKMLGYYYDDGGIAYLIASDGVSSTYYFTGTAWTLITNTFAASAMTQFNKQAWMLAPVGSANPGGYWSPSGGFTAEPNMPRGEVIVSMKLRLWVAIGRDAQTNGTRLFFSKVLGQTGFWSVAPDFIEIGGGDGQNIVNMSIYYQNLLIFRTSSIYSFQFTTDPTNGTVNLVVPGVGLSSRDALVAYENYFYFMDGSRAYEFINNRANQINVKVPFVARSQIGIYSPYSVSVFNQRILFTFWDVTYVYSLKTRSWSVWSSSVRGPIGKLVENEWANQYPEAVAFSNALVAPQSTTVNLATNPSFEAAGAVVELRRNRFSANPRFAVNAADWQPVAPSTLARITEGAAFAGEWVMPSAGTPSQVISSLIPGGVAGKYYAARVKIRKGAALAAGAGVIVRIYDGTAWIASLAVTPTAVLTEYVVPASAASVATASTGLTFRIYGSGSWAAGDSVVFTDVIVEEVSGAGVAGGSYFDGSTSPADDLTYAWLGTAHASASVQQANAAAAPIAGTFGNDASSHAISSADWAASGGKSFRSVPRRSVGTYQYAIPALTVGKVYTVLATSRRKAPIADSSSPMTRTLSYGVGTAVSGQQVRDQGPNTAGVYEHRITFTAEAGRLILFYNGGAIGEDLWWDKFLLVEGAYTGPYFDGAALNTQEATFAWTGTANASTSTATTKRNARTLSIRDGLTNDTEPMKHVIRTKNYNYEASAAYKRLFWWGVDSMFRSRVVGEAVPITYNYAVMWAALKGKTWGELLTWGQPISDGLQVEVSRDTVGTGAQRKFTKFPKGLRFRQIYFRLTFDSDGSISSSPVRIFSLTTVVKSKQRVSKEIT